MQVMGIFFKVISVFKELMIDQMRHQSISENVFAPDHLALCGTGAKAHPRAGVGRDSS